MNTSDNVLALGADMGMSSVDVQAVIRDVGERNPMLLIGGFNVDLAIVAVYGTLRLEDGRDADGPPLTHEEILGRIDETLQVMYAGLI